MDRLKQEVEKLAPLFARRKDSEKIMERAQSDYRAAEGVRNDTISEVHQSWQAAMVALAESEGWESPPKTQALEPGIIIVGLPDRKLWDSRHPDHVYEWHDSRPSWAKRNHPGDAGHWCPECKVRR